VAPYQSALHALLEELEIEFPSFREGEHVWENDHGHDGVREWMEEMKRDWTTFEVRPERYLELAATES